MQNIYRLLFTLLISTTASGITDTLDRHLYWEYQYPSFQKYPKDIAIKILYRSNQNTKGVMGKGFECSYNRGLKILSDSTIVEFSSGRKVNLKFVGKGDTLASLGDTNQILIRGSSGYKRVLSDEVTEHYSSAGLLESIHLADSRVIKCIYDTKGKIKELKKGDDFIAIFSYSNKDLLQHIFSRDGSSCTLFYDSQQHLRRIRFRSYSAEETIHFKWDNGKVIAIIPHIDR